MQSNKLLANLDKQTDLYFHLPFCAKKCGYCYFYSLANQRPEKIEAYLNSLEQEIILKKRLWRFPKAIRAVYVGGGTPSYLAVDLLEKFFAILRLHFDIKKVAEFTMEINPNFCDFEKLDLLKRNGVNRLSFGIQTVNSEILRKIKRSFERKKVIELIGYAKKLKFEIINLDFMFRLPGQTLASIAQDLKFIQKLDPTSVYWYETKDITAYMKAINANNLGYAKFDQFISKGMQKLKYQRTMTEFYSKTNKPCQYTFDFLLANYVIGFGPFSISRYQQKFVKNVAELEQYMAFLKQGKLPIFQEFKLDAKTEAVNFLAYLLRFGSVNLAFLEKKFHINLEIILAQELALLKKYNFLKQFGKKIFLTETGLARTPDVQIVLLRKYQIFLKQINVFLGRDYELK